MYRLTGHYPTLQGVLLVGSQILPLWRISRY